MRILLALDDSRYSAGITDALIAQVRTKGVEVRLLHVLEPFPARLATKIGSRESPDFVAARMQQRVGGKRLLAQAAEKLRAAGFKVTTLIEEGDPRSSILDLSAIWRADLIMVGSHGRTGLDRFLTGSVSEAVAKHAECSVEIIRIRPKPAKRAFVPRK